MLSLPGTKKVFRERFSLMRQSSFQEKLYLHNYLPVRRYTLRAYFSGCIIPMTLLGSRGQKRTVQR